LFHVFLIFHLFLHFWGLFHGFHTGCILVPVFSFFFIFTLVRSPYLTLYTSEYIKDNEQNLRQLGQPCWLVMGFNLDPVLILALDDFFAFFPFFLSFRALARPVSFLIEIDSLFLLSPAEDG